MKKEKILPILLAIWPYIIMFPSLFEGEITSVLLYLYLPLTIVVYVWNVMNAFRYDGENAAKELAFYNMVIKIIHIPFYLGVFILGTMFLLASVVPALIFFTPMVLIYLIITDIILLVVSSMYGVNAIRRASKNGLITGKSAIKNLVMHFVFILDVISAINIYCKIIQCASRHGKECMVMKSFVNKKTVYVELQLNARLQPIHRGEIFEDMFIEILEKYELGEVVGAGTCQMNTGEIKECDIKMDIYHDKLDAFISFLHKIDIIPKGSCLLINEETRPIGEADGLALYLNGTELPTEVYKNNDINELISLLDQALDGVAQRLSYWEGFAETALYYYGKDYSTMKDKIAEIVKNHPLCQKCRIEKIA